MKKILCLLHPHNHIKLGLLSLFILFSCVRTIAQQRTFYLVKPDWNNNSSPTIKENKIKSDSVYLYLKKQNSKDSTLSEIEYFDSLGNLMEQDEFDLKGDVWRIMNCTYQQNGFLLQRETAEKMMVSINGSNVSRNLETYEYDSLGKEVIEKTFHFHNDTLDTLRFNVVTKEYDGHGNQTKEYISLYGNKTYLHRMFLYSGNTLSEIQILDSNKNWMYTYLYEYDSSAGSKSVYLLNTQKRLIQDYFYDESKRLVRRKDYDQNPNPIFFVEETFAYRPDGLVNNQTYRSVAGKKYYFKHFYSR